MKKLFFSLILFLFVFNVGYSVSVRPFPGMDFYVEFDEITYGDYNFVTQDYNVINIMEMSDAQLYADFLSIFYGDYVNLSSEIGDFFVFDDDLFILNQEFSCGEGKNFIILFMGEITYTDFQSFANKFCSYNLYFFDDYELLSSSIIANNITYVYNNGLYPSISSASELEEYKPTREFYTNNNVLVKEFYISGEYTYVSYNSSNLLLIESDNPLLVNNDAFNFFNYDISNESFFESNNRLNPAFFNIPNLIIIFIVSTILSIIFEKLRGNITLRSILVYISLISGFISLFLILNYFFGLWSLLVIIIPALIILGVNKSSEKFEIELKNQNYKKLHKMVDEVCKKINLPKPDTISLIPGETIAVKGFFKKELIIGYASLKYLNKNELKAIIAHEMGHLKGKDTMISYLIYSFTNALTLTFKTFSKVRRMPAVLYLTYIGLFIYYRVYNFIVSAHSRLLEERADKVAIKVTSKEVFSSALVKYSLAAKKFNFFQHAVLASLQNKKIVKNLYQTFQNFYTKNKSNDKKEINKILEEKTKFYSTHPSIKDRLKYLGVNLEKFKTKKTTSKASGFIPKNKAMEKKLTLTFYDMVFKKMKIGSKDRKKIITDIKKIQ